MDNEVELFWSGVPWCIPGTPWDIIGYSRASFRTGFYIKDLDLMIDAGPQKSGGPKTVLITHCHADHIANIPFTLIGDTSSKPVIFVPERSRDKLRAYITAMFSANFNQEFKGQVASFVGVKGGQVIHDHNANNTKLKIDVYTCIHDVPTVAYGISPRKQRLKEEFFDLKGNGKALCELKRQGIEITETSYERTIVFVWDTTIDVLKDNPIILDYRVVMIECTFIFDDDYEQSLAKKHIHWRSLKPYVQANQNTIFVLVHFSLRYSEADIAAFFKSEGLDNVKPWLQNN